MAETRLDVIGMSCPSCVRHIGGALGRLEGVAEVDVRVREGRVLVRHDGAVEVAALIDAVKDAGYEASEAR